MPKQCSHLLAYNCILRRSLSRRCLVSRQSPFLHTINWQIGRQSLEKSLVYAMILVDLLRQNDWLPTIQRQVLSKLCHSLRAYVDVRGKVSSNEQDFLHNTYRLLYKDYSWFYCVLVSGRCCQLPMRQLVFLAKVELGSPNHRIDLDQIILRSFQTK